MSWNPFKWLNELDMWLSGGNFDPTQVVYTLPHREPRYTGFVPPKHWDYQCPQCHARVPSAVGICWMCAYGSNGNALAYYNMWGHMGNPPPPNCSCRHCRLSQPPPVPPERSVRPAPTNIYHRIEEAFHFSNDGEAHQEIEVRCNQGQWFVECLSCGAMWSVEACNEPAATDGLYFELMCEGDGCCYQER